MGEGQDPTVRLCEKSVDKVVLGNYESFPTDGLIFQAHRLCRI